MAHHGILGGTLNEGYADEHVVLVATQIYWQATSTTGEINSLMKALPPVEEQEGGLKYFRLYPEVPQAFQRCLML